MTDRFREPDVAKIAAISQALWDARPKRSPASVEEIVRAAFKAWKGARQISEAFSSGTDGRLDLARLKRAEGRLIRGLSGVLPGGSVIELHHGGQTWIVTSCRRRKIGLGPDGLIGVVVE